MTPDLPSEAEISRWFGEPVEMIILSSDMFEVSNNNNLNGLKERYRGVCLDFMIHTRAHFAIRCNQNDPFIASYPKCLRAILNSAKNGNSKRHEFVYFVFVVFFNSILKKFCFFYNSTNSCNENAEVGLKLPFNEEATINKCTKYEQVMLKIYKKAIQLAIEDREHHSDEKVSY